MFIQGKFFHTLANFASPLVFQDWDEQYDNETGNNFPALWSATRNEFWALHFLFLIENLLLCIPLWMLNYSIGKRNEHLSQYLPPVENELYSTDRVFTFAWAVPLTIALSAIASHALLYAYYYYCHPWSALFQQEMERFKGKMNCCQIKNKNEHDENIELEVVMPLNVENEQIDPDRNIEVSPLNITKEEGLENQKLGPDSNEIDHNS